MTTKNKIIDVIIDYIKAGVNLDIISMQKIANEVGIGKSTLYEYFQSKQDLIEHVYIYLINHYHERLQAIDYLNNFETILKNQIKLIIEVMDEAKTIMEAILQNTSNFVDNNKLVIKEIEKVNRSMEKQFFSILELGYKEQIISNKYLDISSQYIVKGLIGSLSAQYVSGNTHFTEEEVIDFIYKSLLVYLK
ncbi:MAG TPA: TetR/AcrR family transcriptional regulator [Acholeplasmataceae bacterium]|nr:TetR/AcrR family transcriptional regulator [Acholeplasmataceae bacterium]